VDGNPTIRTPTVREGMRAIPTPTVDGNPTIPAPTVREGIRETPDRISERTRLAVRRPVPHSGNDALGGRA